MPGSSGPCTICVKRGVTLRKTCAAGACTGNKVCLGCSRKWTRTRPTRTACCGAALAPHVTSKIPEFTMRLRNGKASVPLTAREREANEASAARSREAVLASSVMCPKCQVSIVKSEGCSVVTCAACHTRFSFLCGCEDFWYGVHVCPVMLCLNTVVETLRNTLANECQAANMSMSETEHAMDDLDDAIEDTPFHLLIKDFAQKCVADREGSPSSLLMATAGWLGSLRAFDASLTRSAQMPWVVAMEDVRELARRITGMPSTSPVMQQMSRAIPAFLGSLQLSLEQLVANKIITEEHLAVTGANDAVKSLVDLGREMTPSDSDADDTPRANDESVKNRVLLCAVL